MLRGGSTSFYHADGLGSITSLSTAAGSIANTYTYDSFGKLTASTGSLANPFRYTARESDTETGLYYYRFRYFDSVAGRFLNEDPTGFSGGTNFYTYVSNHPTDFVDPKGLLRVCCRPANLGGGVTAYALLNLVPPPCHCFLQLGDGHSGTLGGYHQSGGNLVLRSDDNADSNNGPNHNSLDCSTVPGKQCENDQRALNAFQSLPKTLGGYGFGASDAGTSNDAARLLLKQSGLDSTLPSCAWGKGGGALPTFIPQVLLPTIIPGFPRPKPVV